MLFLGESSSRPREREKQPAKDEGFKDGGNELRDLSNQGRILRLPLIKEVSCAVHEANSSIS